MERYTQFRDKATGISPFMPVMQTNVIGLSESGVQQFIKVTKLDIVGGFLLVLVKAVLILPFALVSLFLSSSIGLRNTVTLNRAILFIAGLKNYELSIENLKTKKLTRAGFYPSKNELYFVNFTSPLDLLLLMLVSNDEFILLIPNKSGNLQQLSVLEFMSKSVSGLDISHGNKPLNYSNFKNKIIYVFAEGTTSNAKAVLPFLLTQGSFDTFLQSMADNKVTIHKIRSIGIKHYPSTLVTPLQSNLVGFFYKLMTHTSFSAKLRINNINETNPLEKSLVKIRSSFTNNGKFKLVSEEFNIEMKARFISAYRKK